MPAILLGLGIVAEASAETLNRTDPGHLGGSRSEPRYDGGRQPPRLHRPDIDPFRAGVIWRAEGVFVENARYERDLSRACREGRLGRLAGGFADFADVRVPAAPPRGIYNPDRIPLYWPVYFFRYEHSTNCQVYRPR